MPVSERGTQIDWVEGLPLEILAKIAGGRHDLRCMRGAFSNWKTAYEMSVVVARIPRNTPPPSPGFATRFLDLKSLTLGVFTTPADLSEGLKQLQQLPKLEILILGQSGASLDNENIQLLTGFNKLSSLDIEGNNNLTSTGLEVFGKLPLTSLSMTWCQFRDKGLESLRGCPLTKLDLSRGDGLLRNGVGFLKGMPLTVSRSSLSFMYILRNLHVFHQNIALISTSCPWAIFESHWK